MDTIIEQTTDYVRAYMSNYDASHDFSHIERVLRVAKSIEDAERKRNPKQELNGDVITLAALLHDVGDRKYLKPGEDATTLIWNYLKSIGCPLAIAEQVQTICTNVSYSNELKYEENTASLCKQIPELAIVQDADRLDAIGAIGVARMFCYTGAKQNERGLSIEHFHEKLLLIEGRMKTMTGKNLAREKTKRMRTFLEWWAEEVPQVETA